MLQFMSYFIADLKCFFKCEFSKERFEGLSSFNYTGAVLECISKMAVYWLALQGIFSLNCFECALAVYLYIYIKLYFII